MGHKKELTPFTWGRIELPSVHLDIQYSLLLCLRKGDNDAANGARNL